MSDFLQFAMNKGAEYRVTHDDVAHWAGALDNWDFSNAAALQIAIKYHRRQLTYSFCDQLMKDLWSAVLAGLATGRSIVPEPFYEIYEAFDGGEFHRAEDKSDNPVADFTDPAIAELIARLGA